MAACRNHDPEIFYAEESVIPDLEVIESARAICVGCPERIPCLDYALKNENWGMWGGLTASERRYFRRGKYHKIQKVIKLKLI